MIGHFVIAVLVFAGVLAPFVLIAECSHQRERRRSETRTAPGSRSALHRMPTPAAWDGEPWIYCGLNERIARAHELIAELEGQP